jgi:hypothetical protein
MGMKGSSNDTVEELSRHLPGDTKEDHGKPQEV